MFQVFLWRCLLIMSCLAKKIASVIKQQTALTSLHLYDATHCLWAQTSACLAIDDSHIKKGFLKILFGTLQKLYVQALICSFLYKGTFEELDMIYFGTNLD